LRAVVSLPAETFCPFGANVKTNIVFGRKWLTGEAVSTDYNVSMVKVDSVGYDASGRLRKDSDLADASQSIAAFLDKEGW
jgi:type I restriction enzyme M protein